MVCVKRALISGQGATHNSSWLPVLSAMGYSWAVEVCVCVCVCVWCSFGCGHYEATLTIVHSLYLTGSFSRSSVLIYKWRYWRNILTSQQYCRSFKARLLDALRKYQHSSHLWTWGASNPTTIFLLLTFVFLSSTQPTAPNVISPLSLSFSLSCPLTVLEYSGQFSFCFLVPHYLSVCLPWYFYWSTYL